LVLQLIIKSTNLPIPFKKSKFQRKIKNGKRNIQITKGAIFSKKNSTRFDSWYSGEFLGLAEGN
jgi:hypothetical protein